MENTSRRRTEHARFLPVATDKPTTFVHIFTPVRSDPNELHISCVHGATVHKTFQYIVTTIGKTELRA
jgi:hypothetical protein